MKKILTILLASASLVACQSEGDEQTGPATDRVTIAPVITRATEVSFEEGDRIGLTILRGEESYASNELLTYDGSLFTGSLNWYSVSTETATLTAYYPYAEAGMPETFTVQADQSEGQNYTNSDLMAARKSDVTPSADAVTMTFKHLLTKILVNAVNTSGSAISEVILQGSVPSAAVDLTTQTVTAAESAAADIKAQQVEADKTYRAIVVPQTVAFTLAVKTADGKEWTTPLASATLVQGGQYTVNAALTPDGLKVSLTGDIENWGDEGVIPPASDEPTLEEHLDENYILYDGERYATVTLSNGTTWMADNLRYLPEGYTPSSDPTADSHIWYPYELDYAQAVADGAVQTNLDPKYVVPKTDAASIEKYGYLYDMQAALGTEVTVDNYKTFEDAQGICPKGWHIPNRAEYFDLVGASNANAGSGEASGTKLYDGALFWGADGTGKTYGQIANAVGQGFGYQFSGCRFTSSSAAGRYQSTVVYSGNSTRTDWYGNMGLTYFMTSTSYQLNTSGVPQFFCVMSTFTTSNYPEGRLSLAFTTSLLGQGIRCVKDHDIDFYAKFEGTLIKPQP